jgi:hypothetical protein
MSLGKAHVSKPHSLDRHSDPALPEHHPCSSSRQPQGYGWCSSDPECTVCALLQCSQRHRQPAPRNRPAQSLWRVHKQASEAAYVQAAPAHMEEKLLMPIYYNKQLLSSPLPDTKQPTIISPPHDASRPHISKPKAYSAFNTMITAGQEATSRLAEFVGQIHCCPQPQLVRASTAHFPNQHVPSPHINHSSALGIPKHTQLCNRSPLAHAGVMHTCHHKQLPRVYPRGRACQTAEVPHACT